MKITMPVVVSWLFAFWWLVVGIRDFSLIRYNASGSTRYRKALPLLLCLFASFDLALLGYFLSTDRAQLVLITLSVFALVWIAWSVVAKRSWDKTTRIP
jgi:hypothetical protein